jgi:cytochrome b
VAAMEEKNVKVWDAPVRLFHWALVLLFAFMFFTGKMKGNWMDWHLPAGYAILALILFRIVWGFVGSTHARFASFFAGPSRGLAYARNLLTGGPAHSAGHNPLGGWMVVVLLLAILVQVVTGLFGNDDISIEGPLAKLVSKSVSDRMITIHYWNFYVLLALAGIHIAAVLFHWLVKKENLIGAMFTGVKRLPADAAQAVAAARFASPWLALVVLLVAALAVYLVVKRPF